MRRGERDFQGVSRQLEGGVQNARGPPYEYIHTSTYYAFRAVGLLLHTFIKCSGRSCESL